VRPYSHRREYQQSKTLVTSAKSIANTRLFIRFPAQLDGVRVLDVGAGQSACVAWLNAQGADAYALDPRYSNLRRLDADMDTAMSPVLEKLERRYGRATASMLHAANETTRADFRLDVSSHGGHYIAGLAGSLPFATGSFDFIYSTNCIGKGIDEDESLLSQVVSECLRVLRSGGELQIWPFMGRTRTRSGRNQVKVLQDLPHTIEEIHPDGVGLEEYPLRVSLVKP